MSYNSSTGIVQDTGANDGVSIRDVQRALGVSSNDLGTLCVHSNIKMLSKYKPIKDTLNGKTRTPQVLTDQNYIERNWGFDIPKFNGSEFESKIKGAVDNTNMWSTYDSATDVDMSIGNGWVYKKPVVNTNFMRLTDFNGYNNKSEMVFVENTLKVSEGIKMVTKMDGSYNPVFTFDMQPFCPQNFAILSGYRLGIAIYSTTVKNGQIYFYVGTSAIGQSASYEQTLLTMTGAMFNSFLSKMNSPVVNEATFYVVGFFAPSNFSGWNNITDSNAYTQMNNLVPMPGVCYDTFLWRYISGSGQFDMCLLALDAHGTSELRVGGTQFSAQLYAITNNYDTTETVIFYPSYLMYTYDVVHSNGTIDPTYSQTSRASFGTNTGSIEVTNTQTSGGHAVAKTTDVTSYNIVANIPIDRRAATEGTIVKVHLWYLTYNSQAGTRDEYRECGLFSVPIGELPRDV